MNGKTILSLFLVLFLCVSFQGLIIVDGITISQGEESAEKVTKGINFDGNDEINCGDENDLDGAGAWSMSCWAKWNDGESTTSNPFIITKRNGCLLRSSDSNSAYMAVWMYSGSWHEGPNTGTSFDDDTWHHYLAVYDDPYLRLYVDGTQQGSGTNIGSVTTNSNAYEICIGNIDGGSQYWNGQITEVAFWKSAITNSTHISNLASGDKGVPLNVDSSNLVRYFPLDDITVGQSGSGETFDDKSTKASDGTGNGNLTSVSVTLP